MSRGALARALPLSHRMLSRGAIRALSSRAASVQDLLLSHPAIAHASCSSPDGEAVHAVVMPRKGALYTPWHGMHGNVHDADGYGTLIDWTQKQLRSGLLQRISFVHKPEALPAATHERVTLNELLQAVHRQVDANSDGVITHDEMRAFMDAHGLSHLAPLLADLGSPDDLAYADFKELLLGTHVLHVDAEAAARGDESQYAISSSSTLVGLVADVLFDEADADGDGAVSLQELEALFARRGIRDAARAAAAFERSDANRDSQIDRGEFLELLLGEGLVNEATANS